MKLEEFLEKYESMSNKDKTKIYNEFEIQDRLDFLESLTEEDKKEFIDDIRKQAVADFWTHERELIEQGQSTRDWTPEQIEEIMKISEKTGKESVNGAVAYDINGEAYYGHHMLDVSTHPEYAGDWRNIQALDYTEHYVGAHDNHKTSVPTVGYYDVETGKTIAIEIPEGGIDFDEVGYPPKGTCIFKSNAEIKKIYGIEGNITDGEMLALKNLELSMSENGGISDFERSLDVATRYKCNDFQTKYGIMSESDLLSKYDMWDELTKSEKSVIRAQEYYTSKGIEKYDIYSCYDADGKFMGLNVQDRKTNTALIVVKGDVAYSGLTSDVIDFESDAAMIEKFGDERYHKLNAVEKLELKEIDKVVRDLTLIDDKTYSSNLVDAYFNGSGKTMDSLNETDKALIGLADKLTNKISGDAVDSLNTKYLSMAAKYNKLAQTVGYAGGIIDVVCNVIQIGTAISEARNALEKGEKDRAAGIMVGAATEFAVATVGGAALTNAIAPYLIGFGAATLGPAGAILGGLFAGIIGYGAAGMVGALLDDTIVEAFDSIDGDYDSASMALMYDPLVIDFDGDGFELLDVEEGVYFDEDAVGLVEKTQWVAPDDAVLAIDLDKNGIINDGSELFGTSTRLEDNTLAKSGFESLAQYDKNNDGVIDENDEVFSKLVAWQDKNSDGISQEDELYTLNDLGVSSISVKYADENGINAADIKYNDGTVTKIGEFDFESNLYDTIEKEKIEISDEIEELPDVRAIGNVASLHTLLQLDATGELKELVNKFIAANTCEDKEQVVTDILYYITGAQDVDAGSRGRWFDAQKLTVIESFMGEDFIGTGGSNPVDRAAPILQDIYTEIYEIYYNTLNAQTHMSDYMGMVRWTTDAKGDKYLDTSLFDIFVSACKDNDIDMSEEVGEIGRFIPYMNADNVDNIKNYVKPESVKLSYFFTGTD